MLYTSSVSGWITCINPFTPHTGIALVEPVHVDVNSGTPEFCKLIIGVLGFGDQLPDEGKPGYCLIRFEALKSLWSS